MTCIVGIRQNGVAYVAGDTLASNSNGDVCTRIDEKVFQNGEFIIGFTTSYRMGQILRYQFRPTPIPKGMDLMEYMVVYFVEEIRYCFNRHGYGVTVEDKDNVGGTFIVGVRGRIFEIQDDFQVSEPSDAYTAVGCGYKYALGALSEVACNYPPDKACTAALNAATKFSGFVGGKYTLLNTGGDCGTV